MQHFTVTFSRNPVTVVILLTVPLLAAALFISPLLLLPDLPDWIILSTIIIMMCSAIAGVVFIVRKYGSVRATVNMNEDGISIRLGSRTIFYNRLQYAANWSSLKNVSSNFDPQHQRRFYMIRFAQPDVAVSLMPDETTGPDQETAFGKELLGHVDRYNQHVRPSSVIRRRGFYDSWWAKGLTIIAYLMVPVVLITHFIDPSAMDRWRVISTMSYVTIWLIAFHINRRKRSA